MNRKSMTKLSFLALASMALAACSNGGVVLEEADQIFDGTSIYFVSGSSENVSAKMEINGDITGVACGRTAADSDQYSYRNGVLTLGGKFISSISGTGEKAIIITTSSGKIALNALAVTSVITTAEEFQAINTDAVTLQGTYVLGNDIDLSGIDNFEPLGWYTEESDPNNAYFHGILEGNGHTIKNAKVYYSDNVASNYNVYAENGTYRFTHDGHTNGDNIGLFQVIGSSGIVRNVNFSNIDVRGRTICGVVAGNVMGTIENCYVDSQCSVEMGTHYYDDDCNMGGVAGIVAGSGQINNVISEVTSLHIGAPGATTINGVSIEEAGIYLDWNNDYTSQTGNGWDHGNESDHNPWWKFCAVDKDKAGTKYTDSNGSYTNGVYAFAGKTWGSVSNCVAKKFKITPMSGTTRDVNFSQTHLAANKPTSGDSDLGSLTDNLLLDSEGMKTASNYGESFSYGWNVVDGSVPTLKAAYSFVPSEAAE